MLAGRQFMRKYRMRLDFGANTAQVCTKRTVTFDEAHFVSFNSQAAAGSAQPKSNSLFGISATTVWSARLPEERPSSDSRTGDAGESPNPVTARDQPRSTSGGKGKQARCVEFKVGKRGDDRELKNHRTFVSDGHDEGAIEYNVYAAALQASKTCLLYTSPSPRDY